MRLFDLCYKGEVHKIQLDVSFYEVNGNLAIRMIECENGMPAEPWSTLTINTGIKCRQYCAYIDVDKNGKEILAWIEDNRLAVPTGNSIAGYPEYRFNSELLREIMLEDYIQGHMHLSKSFSTGA